ncbi:dihydroorotase [Kaustia mangrovi]|uniref:Dihydroorotase n=1 Tax=Kaustia mangrovi TaxID=2593653 RepID=A0A7S8HAZ7_9HYPH|nr:dihydroorotase [Kaustia mangrovi]QPC41608.1 dihydroorotase [Kaustia mangrovi]
MSGNAPDTGPNGRRAFVNARLVDPAQGLDGPGGLIVEDGTILACGADVTADSAGSGTEIRDCAGAIVMPGLIDMRVFTGEPGAEHRETLASASEAAAAGGVTTLIVMPNTNPVIDDVALVDFILRRARDTAIVRIAPMAALTKGTGGVEMTEIGMLREAGAVAVTDGIVPVTNARLLRRVLAYAHDFGMLVVQHVEEPELARGGVMNEGEVATRLGLSGIPIEAEVIMLERDLRLVALTGARYHAAQISCRASLDLIRRAKENGLPVTCGVSVNHLALNENDIGAYRTFFKLSPPLRGEDDRAAMVEGLRDGLIDVIVSSHDPQEPDTKRLPFSEAAFGAIGLETLLPAALSLHHDGAVPLGEIVAALATRPARILGFDMGTLAPGTPADLAVVDPQRSWRVGPDSLRSKSKNSPFEHRMLEGRVLETVVAGRTVFALGAE